MQVIFRFLSNLWISDLFQRIEPAYIYYKELAADKKNIFTANIAEKNEVENVKFSKSQEYGVTGMTIIPDIKDSSILKVTNEKKT